MVVAHISDTHGLHRDLVIPKCDVVIHSGDAVNSRDHVKNTQELFDFLEWYRRLDIRHKILVPGNHHTAEERFKYLREDIVSQGIHYLCHDVVEIEGIRIFGSPYTPNFHDWAFMKSRTTIGRLWDQIPECDIVVTHGPPKYILDFNGDEHVGDSALGKAIKKLRPRYHMFGHVHSNSKCDNHGVLIRDGITYSNAAHVMDGGGVTNCVNLFEL